MMQPLQKPRIDGASDRERIEQIIRYLYRLIDELNLALEAVEEQARADGGAHSGTN